VLTTRKKEVANNRLKLTAHRMNFLSARSSARTLG
jgi:hypothetical protein